MPFNTTAAIQLFEARKHLPAHAKTVQLCSHALNLTDDCIYWFIEQAPRYDYIDVSLLEALLPLDRIQREPLVPHFFRALGIQDFITLDSNTRNGSVTVDFNGDIQRDTGFTSTFDLVDNCGVTEHVFDQRAAFENIHRLCNPGGLMMHRIPMFGIMNIALYGVTPMLLQDLATANGYEMLDLRVANRWGDTVRALLPGDDGADRDYRAAIPMHPGMVSEGGVAFEKPHPTLPTEFQPESLNLPAYLNLADILKKTPAGNMEFPLARVCRALDERGQFFRPESPGELYAMCIFRKVHDDAFCVPYQGNNLADIESPAMRVRYRRQFEALGVAVSEADAK